MIDEKTYQRLHKRHYSVAHIATDDSYLNKRVANDDPPPAPYLYILPAIIRGYLLKSKTWSKWLLRLIHELSALKHMIPVEDFRVDLIRDVTWNKNAFSNLVIDEDSKDLIRALVLNQVTGKKGADIISNKGNGLIMLLHGSPGTGKTFTAESVAELAERPIFPVTCGDVGTDPTTAEKYLNSVLYLGKIWKCVVLLDEAEVFLEQRTLSDLTRNALVSVFLRALEYYEGVLILTTNRVGTFDEAFKSRIQLALHYQTLGVSERKQIWRNFFTHLKSSDDADTIDIDDLETYIPELAEHEINGREIRNSISTARKLAQYKGKRMNYAHLKHSMKVMDRFNKYLTGLRQGLTEDEVAKEEGVRA